MNLLSKSVSKLSYSTNNISKSLNQASNNILVPYFSKIYKNNIYQLASKEITNKSNNYRQPIKSSFPYRSIEIQGTSSRNLYYKIKKFFSSQLSDDNENIIRKEFDDEEQIMNFIEEEEAKNIVKSQIIQLDEILKYLRDDKIDKKIFSALRINKALSIAQYIDHEMLLEDCEDLVIKVATCEEDLLIDFDVSEIIDFFIYISVLPFKKIPKNKEVLERIETVLITKLNVANFLENINSTKAGLLNNLISSCITLNNRNVKTVRLADAITKAMMESNSNFNSIVKFSMGYNAIFDYNIDIYNKYPNENILNFNNSNDELDPVFFKDHVDYLKMCYLNILDLCSKEEIDFDMKLMAMHLLPKITSDYLIVDYKLPLEEKQRVLNETFKITSNYLTYIMKNNYTNIAENCGSLISNITNYCKTDYSLISSVVTFCSFNISKMSIVTKFELLYTTLKSKNSSVFNPQTVAVMKVLIKEINKTEDKNHINIEKHAMAAIYKTQIKKITSAYNALSKKHRGNIHIEFKKLISRSINHFPFAGVDYTKELDTIYNNFTQYELFKYTR